MKHRSNINYYIQNLLVIYNTDNRSTNVILVLTDSITNFNYMEIYTKYIKERIGYYTLYKANEPIKCLIKTYYGSHNKNSNYNYAYKIEHIVI